MLKRIKIIFGLCILCVSAVSVGRGEDWTSLGKDNVRSRTATEKLSTSFTAAWQYNGASEIVSSPAVSDGIVVFGATDGLVRALKETDGTLLWSFQTGDEIIASPCIDSGRVYIPSTDGKIYCLNLFSGSPIWDYATGGTEMSSPVVSGNILYTGSGFPNSKMLAINTLNQQLVWTRPAEQIVYSSPAISGNRLFIGCDSGRYYALNQTGGSEIWSYNTGGAVLLSAPLADGNSVYLLPGGNNANFYRVDMNSANWTTNWQIALNDLNPPSSGNIISTKIATSSPMKAGVNDLVAFTIRFDYAIDTNADDTVDQYLLNEYLIAIDTTLQLMKWQIQIGSLVTSNQNFIPPYGLCPSPAYADASAGNPAFLVALSSSNTEVKLIKVADGQGLTSYPLSSGCLASPVVANSRIYAVARDGLLYVFQCTDNRAPAPPVSGFSPANNETVSSAAPIINWNSAVDPDLDILQYLIRVDDDGEVIENYDYQTITALTSVTLPYSVPSDTNLVYALRSIDDDGAYSGWSALQSFWVNRPAQAPLPPTNLSATPGNGSVTLSWTGSSSNDIKGYFIYYQEQGGSWTIPQFIGNVTTYTVNWLTNGLNHTFNIMAQDYDGLLSSQVSVSAQPAYPVMLNNAPYSTLTDALASAASGDTIKLGVGTINVPYTLFVREGVNIQGYSPQHTILDGTGLDRILLLTAGSGKGIISNLTVYGAQVGIDVASRSVALKNTIIRNCNIGVLAGTGSTIDIINNTIINNSYAGIQLASNAVVRNNIIIRNGYGIYAETGLAPALSYNNIYGSATANYYGITAGLNDISFDVLFMDETNDDYREQSNSVTIDMGDPADGWSQEPNPHGGRINMGAYGNTPYAAPSSPFHIATTVLSDGESAAYYNAKISTAGGSPPVTWAITTGQLPPAATLNSFSGIISGNLPPGSAGNYQFTVNATDTLGGSDARIFTISIRQASGNTLAISTSTLSDGEAGTTYSAYISVAAGGFAPYSWSIINGNLPANLSLVSATGEISGTLAFGTEGTYPLTVRVTDADNFSVDKVLTMRVNPRSGLVTSGSSGSSSDVNLRCFIATAAYGSPFAPSVKVLRQFRDRYLTTNPPGRWFVANYYRFSPPLAGYIHDHNWARTVAQIGLVPVVAMSYFALHPLRIALTILLCVFALILCRSLLFKRTPKERPVTLT